jgi:hypothetical protein
MFYFRLQLPLLLKNPKQRANMPSGRKVQIARLVIQVISASFTSISIKWAAFASR